jgi:hypothetical protein
MSERFILCNRRRSILFGVICVAILAADLPAFAQRDARQTMPDGQMLTGLPNGNPGAQFWAAQRVTGDVMSGLHTYHDPTTGYGYTGANHTRWIGSGGHQPDIWGADIRGANIWGNEAPPGGR